MNTESAFINSNSSAKRSLICRALLVVLAASLLGGSARAAELAGVTLPDTLSAGGKTLKLNGLGLRKKSFVKVYVGGLYVETASKDAEQILAADQAKAICMHYVRSLSKKQLVDGFQEGFEANAKDKAGQKPAFDQLLALVPEVKEGDTLTFVYVPGKGTTLKAGDKGLGTFEGKGFAEAVFSIWLGPKPPTKDLQTGMLGLK
ncbi:MAG TPA: chalcone isomerase family protein [Candidatus Acidoferrum sp.]|nr:chalcone isomerase family protein [Candidatus Acidoferrum sp.]